MPWFKNTIFVITADHTSSEIEFPETRTAWGFYSVPIIYFTPDHSLTGMDTTTITQQIDILPTVLEHLHYDKPFVAFGTNAFDKNAGHFALNYKDNNYQLYSGDHILQFNGSASVGLYNFKNDPLLKKNILDNSQTVHQAMELQLKAIIQQYNNRLIEDRLTIQ